MTNEEKIQEITSEYSSEILRSGAYYGAKEMAEWKDEQPILELGGWHTDEPTEDGWYLVDTPNFPKNCYCVVAEWDKEAKNFYSEASDYPIDFHKWKLIERR